MALYQVYFYITLHYITLHYITLHCKNALVFEDVSEDIEEKGHFRGVKITPLVVHIDQKILVSPGLTGIHSSVLR